MRRLQALVTWSILALLVAWPPIHMVLARRYHFSTWRYGGFGMYAAPDGGDRDVYVFIQSCARDAQAPASADGNDRDLGFYYLVRGPRVDLLPLPDLTLDEERALARAIKDVRSLSRPGDFDRLARWIDARLAPSSSLAILVTEPHVDLKAGLAYADAFGFLREHGQWSPLPPMRGPSALEAMTKRLGNCP